MIILNNYLERKRLTNDAKLKIPLTSVEIRAAILITIGSIYNIMLIFGVKLLFFLDNFAF
jgi:hypothetical protein